MGVVNSAQLLPAVRDLYSRHPEMYDLEALRGYMKAGRDEALRVRRGAA